MLDLLLSNWKTRSGREVFKSMWKAFLAPCVKLRVPIQTHLNWTNNTGSQHLPGLNYSIHLCLHPLIVIFNQFLSIVQVAFSSLCIWWIGTFRLLKSTFSKFSLIRLVSWKIELKRMIIIVKISKFDYNRHG